jgi:ABC-type bacteriocin/lantibiotic exporter with double-glycine peptidase domain
MGSPPAQAMDSGLCGLALVAGYYRIAGDPAQLSHQLALTGRSAGAEDIVRGANILQLKSLSRPGRLRAAWIKPIHFGLCPGLINEGQAPGSMNL